MTRINTVFDMDTDELASELRKAADAVEEGGATTFMFDRHGNADDGPVYNTVFLKYVEFTDE